MRDAALIGWIIFTAFAAGSLVVVVLSRDGSVWVGCGTFNVVLGLGMSAFWGTRRD